MWHLTITGMFYISVIHAEGKVKVVPVCSVPGKTVLLNFKCHHGISCPPELAILFMPAFGKKPFLLQWWHKYVDEFQIWLPGLFLYLKDFPTI
jgi:hypothetical protein